MVKTYPTGGDRHMANRTEPRTSRTDASQTRRNDRSTEPGEAAEEVASEARTKANEVKDKVVDESKRAKDELQDRAQGFFDELKEALADQVGRVSNALRGAEREFEDQQLAEIAEMPRNLADGIDDVSEYIRERSGRGMRRDFERAVERDPVMIAGGLAVVGAMVAWALRSDRRVPGTRAGGGDADENAESLTGERGSRRGGE
jgi:hypothetical protein